MYPPAIAHPAPSLEIEDQLMDLTLQSKSVGFNPSYYYPKHVHSA